MIDNLHERHPEASYPAHIGETLGALVLEKHLRGYPPLVLFQKR